MLVLASVLVETHPADVATLLSRFVAIADLIRKSIELHARLFQFVERRFGKVLRGKQNVIDPNCRQGTCRGGATCRHNLAAVDGGSSGSWELGRGRCEFGAALLAR